MTQETPCIEWQGPVNKHGYGQYAYRRNGRKTSTTAHRAYWMLKNGPIPEGLHVCHKCDNRLCINTDHLFLGTQLENMRDMQAKGRQNYGHGGRPLSRDQESIERAVNSGMPPREIMATFSVGKDTAYRWIKKFKSSHDTKCCAASDIYQSIYYWTSVSY